MKSQFNRKEVKEISLKNNKLFYVKCFNYCDDKVYYAKNGKLALANSFNENWAFDNEKVNLSKLNKDGIYNMYDIDVSKSQRELFTI